MRKLIAIADESQNALDVLTAVLGLEYDTVQAHSQHELLGVLKARKPELILTNSRFKSTNCFEALASIRRSTEWCKDIPVVIIALDVAHETIVSAKTYRVADLIMKPYEPIDLLQRVGAVLEADEARKRPQIIPPVPPEMKDSVTGFCKKKYMRENIGRVIEAGGAMMIFDLDNYSYASSNVSADAMKKCAGVLSEKLRGNAVLALNDKSSLVAFIPSMNDPDAVESLAAALIAQMRELELNEKLYISVGLSCSPRHGTDFDELYVAADKGLGVARQNGKNVACFYSK